MVMEASLDEITRVPASRSGIKGGRGARGSRTVKICTSLNSPKHEREGSSVSQLFMALTWNRYCRPVSRIWLCGSTSLAVNLYAMMWGLPHHRKPGTCRGVEMKLSKCIPPTISNGVRNACTVAMDDNPSNSSFTAEPSASHEMGFVSLPPEQHKRGER